MWPKFPADLVTFTEDILNEKFHFLRSEQTNQHLNEQGILVLTLEDKVGSMQ